MNIEQLIQAVESRYIQGQIDLQTAMDLINELRGIW